MEAVHIPIRLASPLTLASASPRRASILPGYDAIKRNSACICFVGLSFLTMHTLMRCRPSPCMHK